jgi:hypothetical protein
MPARRLPRALQRAPPEPRPAALDPRPGLPGPAQSRTRRRPQRSYRLRHDHVDAGGKVGIRHAGRMHHLGIGTAHQGREILALADTTSVTVIELRTGEVLSVHDIDPARAYRRNKQQSPGRWPGLSVT